MPKSTPTGMVKGVSTLVPRISRVFTSSNLWREDTIRPPTMPPNTVDGRRLPAASEVSSKSGQIIAGQFIPVQDRCETRDKRGADETTARSRQGVPADLFLPES